MAINDVTYTAESLRREAEAFATTAPAFLPVPDEFNTQDVPKADMANPVAWETIKHGRVHLHRHDEIHRIEFYAMIEGDLFMGCGAQRWMFNPLIDKITIKAPLPTADLQRLQSYAQYLIEQA